MKTGVDPNQEIIKRAREEIERRTGKSPEQLFQEREKRVTDAIQMKIPDRVPVCFRGGFFPLRYTGLPPSAPFYDQDAYKGAIIKTLMDFDPDIFRTTTGDNVSGLALEKLGDKQLLWPGGTLRNDQDFQYLDMEVMKADEYDLFITDPGDYIVRYYLPRRYTSLAPLSTLPPLRSLGDAVFSLVLHSPPFSSPEVIQTWEILAKVGKEQSKFGNSPQYVAKELGFPLIFGSGGVGNSPFDLFVTYLRGMRGTMVDMFKRPQKLLTALERTLEWELARAVPAGPGEIGRRVGGGGNHFQSEEFLSRKQFDTFVWPSWKKALLATIDLGFIPTPILEGKNDDRIECFLELPKGKAFLRLQQIDMVRAKAILDGHICIMGNVPATMLWGGSPQDVEEYCKNLIKVCGKNGGFILDSGSTLEDAKPANVKAMIDSAKKYGRYN